MRIAIDAMGGDNAPDAIISGVLESIELLGESDELILVGQGENRATLALFKVTCSSG